MTNWVACPHCGEKIDAKAKSCRHCGSDEHTGWSDSTEGAVDWNDEEDYAENAGKEFGGRHGGKGKTAFPLWVMLVALVLALLFGWQILRGTFG